ncbi:hypothetical protein CRG98_002161 [Punica granatum]|uniref:Bromo domain-containing protein n=1 Tax=Punica granatum TaxID=22663 RepID=A0A2I0LA48_PUNGR|nr:hypothetical protein CRG98_002161 [Punica granatum]
MGQIVKRKKKGRPPKSDLARRALAEDLEQESRVRRSVRRRNVRYNFVDYDDFIDDDDYFEEDEVDEEEERRREKKVKLVVKLNQGGRGVHARVGGPSDEEEEEEAEAEDDGREEEEDDDEDERGRKVVKKRRISSGGGGEDEEEEDDDENEAHRGPDDDEEKGPVKGDSKELDSPPGLFLKDTYGVYAEPVDPEELPDYHDVIEHPMDFSTVRKKLANGSYSTLEQFESDVFRICSNAMQYNAPDTIYYKQARTIQELGRKKFQKLRTDYERSERQHRLEQITKNDFDSSEKELKSEQKMKSSVPSKKHVKKPPSQPLLEPVGSDFSAGATLAVGGDLQNVPLADQVGNHERPSNNDGILDGSPFLAESNLDKGEDLSTGKGLSTKFWRKPTAVDENRRATYNKSNQPVVRAESIFTTFDGEIKQLVAVGLHAENSYARSLARFAATLGPIAWKVASQRIEQSLSAGSKFGRGWVGEYEPLPTPILMVDKRFSKECFFIPNSQPNLDSRKDFKIPAPVREDPVSNSASEMKPGPVHISSPHGSSGFRLNVAGTANHQQLQSPVSRSPVGTGSKVIKQFELNSLPPTSQCDGDFVLEKKRIDNSDTGALRPGEINMKNLSHPQREVSVPDAVASRSKEIVSATISSPRSMPFKQPDTSGVVGRGLSNGKIVNNGFDNGRLSSPSNGLPNEMQRPPAFFRRQDQGLSDPVQLMRMLAENAQKQQNPQKHSGDSTPAVAPLVSSMRRDTSGNAATAAASVWMSIGGGGFKQATENSSSPRSQIPTTTNSPFNSPRELHHSQMARIRGEFPTSSGGTYFQQEKGNSPLPPPFMQQQSPVSLPNDGQFSNRPMVFPQLMNANLSRFQAQTPWRGIAPHMQQRPKQETLPPDLNIGFQSPGSPGRQSSGVKMDSQQPDLALQL